MSYLVQNLGFLQKVSVCDALLTIVIASVVILLCIFLKYAFQRQLYSKYYPGKPVGFFNFLGNASEFEKDGCDPNVALLKVLGEYNRLFKNSKLFCFWVSYIPFFVITEASAIEELITSSKAAKKGWSYTFLHPWLGTGLLTSFGKKWKSRRKLLTPSFHFEILKEFLPVFNQQSQTLVKVLQKETSENYTDIAMPVTLCSLDIICETTLGVSIGAQQNKESEYVKAVCSISNAVVKRAFKYKYWLDATFMFTEIGKQHNNDLKLLHQFTRSVIQEKKTKLLSGDKTAFDKKRKALMDVLLEHHLKTKELSEEDIREEVDTFAFEGHDTTSTGLTWALYLIGLHKDVQEKLHQEMDRIFGDDTERPVNTDDLKDMNYLDIVLKESQRLYPSVPFIAREPTEDLTINGYRIPKGTQCIAMTYCLHRDENVFPNAEKFDPERFSPENSNKRHPYAYIPFSAGPRNCIGQRFAIMEEKVVMSYILRKFTLESLDSRDKIDPAAELILRPSVPVRIKIKSRNLH